jgi:Rap1a immunity proteins
MRRSTLCAAMMALVTMSLCTQEASAQVGDIFITRLTCKGTSEDDNPMLGASKTAYNVLVTINTDKNTVVLDFGPTLGEAEDAKETMRITRLDGRQIEFARTERKKDGDYSARGTLDYASRSLTSSSVFLRKKGHFLGEYKAKLDLSCDVLRPQTAPTVTTTTAVAAEAVYASANNWLPPCKAFISSAEGKATSPATGSLLMQGICAGNVEAVAYAVFDEGQRHGGLCARVPHGVTREQMVRVVVSYIEARPERMLELFLPLAREAVMDAWPCKP